MEKAEKIKVEGISIGDWFQARMVKWDYDDLDITPPMKIVKIEKDCVRLGFSLDDLEFEVFVDDLQPIPITAEMLEENGWQPPRKDVDLDTWWWTNGVDKAIEAYEYEGEWYLTIIEQKEIQYRNRVGIGLKHIHELQHALRLAKVRKEIVL